MPNVIIRERDLTTNPSFTAVDVAYVPGLSLNEEIIGFDDETGESKNPGPVYCTTTAEFTKMFGSTAPAYTEDYPVEIEYGEEGKTEKKTVVFKAGDIDCGYVYAKELLTAGIPIYYEAVNTTTESLSAEDVYDAMLGKGYGEEQKEKTLDAGTFVAEVTTQEEHTPAKLTFSYNNERYSGVVPKEGDNPKEKGWYVLEDDEYVLTADTTVKSGTTYYEKLDVTFAGINNFNLWVEEEAEEGEETERTSVEVTIKPEYYTVKTTVEGDLVTKVITFRDLAVLVNEEKTIIDYVDKIADGNLTVNYSVFVGEPAETVDSCFLKLADRGTFNVKYITSGGYPTFEYPKGDIVDTMIDVAAAGMGGAYGVFGGGQPTNNTSDDCLPPVDEETQSINGRGDAVALIDHFNIPSRPLGKDNPKSVYAAANNFFTTDEKYSYGAMFTPWCKFVLANSYAVGTGEDIKVIKTLELPLSFAYLKNLGRSIQYYDNFLAIAGVARGAVDYIEYNSTRDKYAVRTDSILTNYIANSYSAPVEAGRGSSVSINPLTRIRPYGEVIWGNRTLQKSSSNNGVKAQGFLNIRNMLSDIKKQCFTVGRELMFEPNSDVLWFSFRNKVMGLMEGLKNGGGLVDYSIVRSPKSGKTKLGVIITVTPLYALECVDVIINITDEEVDVTESTEA